MKTVVTVLGVVVVLVLGAFVLGAVVNDQETDKPQDDQEPPQQPLPSDQVPNNWQTFESREFDFSYRYPFDWQFAEEDEISPIFSAYVKPQGVPVTPPFTHHANITNVSVYPQGVPTEGLFGSTRPATFTPGFETVPEESYVYTLDDGTPFAARFVPANKPSSWNDAGFVWMRVYIDDLETTCIDAEGNEVSTNQCDPLVEDHTIVWNGDVDESVWDTAQMIAQSIELK